MKKNLTKIVASVFLSYASFSSSSLLAADYHVAGCGLGSLLIKDNKMVLQLLSATLNATGIQTFGITTGTSNCKTDGLVKQDKVREVFIAVNFEVLEQEIAAGQGEKLSAFSSLLGCPAEQNDRFSRMTQSSYDKLFSGKPTPDSMLYQIKQEIVQDSVLSASCKL
ncbi:DUF3015 domain-containing protein [Leptospira gomenensis]|uniref:DUF3015 domain-containing protein n=1 Tax=Leptospira gomenensis TaxID=2484974 RepID=A0A5F1YGG5_9LEPT|nr:DUF3015 family protein [Leptospira gomenensis]TGK31505.1 DUF3015 domain-containing protein [Leptospira gomenensis]TGK32495.1 DUF3015 domain-containing protein [Leptospira gomenensis]TGK46210.1 DUF3015 domain-containing protein [Leptospira gomenensis]TGK54735.1 DUF3015 domain-containing protein [Leptospira gomenensis]